MPARIVSRSERFTRHSFHAFPRSASHKPGPSALAVGESASGGRLQVQFECKQGAGAYGPWPDSLSSWGPAARGARRVGVRILLAWDVTLRHQHPLENDTDVVVQHDLEVPIVHSWERAGPEASRGQRVVEHD